VIIYVDTSAVGKFYGEKRESTDLARYLDEIDEPAAPLWLSRTGGEKWPEGRHARATLKTDHKR
jgi:hypothetical protein